VSRARAGRLLLLGVVGALVSCSSPAATQDRVPPTTVRTPSQRTASSRPFTGRVNVQVLSWRLPEPVGREAAMPTATGLVVAGGLVAGDQSTGAAYRVDLHNGHAVTLADLPVPVHDVGGAVVQGRPEVIGGGNATEQDVVQSAQVGGGWRVHGHLPSPRSDLAAVTVGDRVFVVGGYDGTTPALADVLVSTGGGVFRVFGRLRVAVRYPAIALGDGAIWVFGGERNGVEVDLLQRVDLRTGRARIAGHLPRPLGHASAVALGGRILLIGGRTGAASLTAAMWWFDPASTTRLRRAGSLPTPLADSALAVVGRSAYLMGGETPALSDHVLRLTLGRS